MGCAKHAPEARVLGRQPIVVEVEFRGATTLSKGSLLGHLYTDERSPNPLARPARYDPGVVAMDRRRIEALYRANGFLEARVGDVDVVQVHRAPPDEPDEDDTVKLVFHVDEGRATAVRAVRFVWRGDAGAALSGGERRQVEALAELRSGQRWSVATFNATLGRLKLQLQGMGRPLADVSGKADLRAAELAADVTIELAPGPYARIAGVRVVGLDRVPADLVAKEVQFAQGEPYSPSIVRQVEGALQAMQVFRWVAAQAPKAEQVRPKAVGTGSVVDLEVRVSEADPQSVRLGGRITFESTRWQQEGVVGYSHTNVFGRLYRFDLDLVVGWAELPGPFAPDAHGPVLQVEPSLSKKGLLEDHLQWTLSPSYRVEIQEGYQYQQPRNVLGVSRWFLGQVRASLAHDVRRVDFFNVSPALDRQSSLLGRDFRDPFLLSFIHSQLDWLLADSMTEPTEGVILTGIHEVAGGALRGDYDFQKVEGIVRAYYKPGDAWQIAARAHSGGILPYGERPGSPFSFKYYLGGATSVRGWAARRLAPRLQECDPDGQSCSSVPVGGQSMVQGNLEVRYNIDETYGVVVFSDMGDVQSGELQFVPLRWNYSAGPGLRVQTPLGLARLDFGYRLNDPGTYPGEPRWRIYFGLGQSY